MEMIGKAYQSVFNEDWDHRKTSPEVLVTEMFSNIKTLSTSTNRRVRVTKVDIETIQCITDAGRIVKLDDAILHASCKELLDSEAEIREWRMESIASVEKRELQLDIEPMEK